MIILAGTGSLKIFSKSSEKFSKDKVVKKLFPLLQKGCFLATERNL